MMGRLFSVRSRVLYNLFLGGRYRTQKGQSPRDKSRTLEQNPHTGNYKSASCHHLSL